MPDLFDLDDAFSSLEREIATISRPPGAAHAVASARRRRRTTYGAIAAAAVLAVGGAAISQGLGGRDGAVGPSDQPLPPPTPLSADAFSAATAGWVEGWGTPDDTQTRSLASVTCLGHNNSTALDHAIRGGEHAYGAGSTEITYMLGMEFPADRTDAAVAAVATKAASCKPTVTSTKTYTDGSQATFYQLPATSGSGDLELWTAQYGDRLALAVMAGTTNEPPADVVGRVDDLLLGALQVDTTFTTGSPIGVPSGSKSASSADFGSVAESDFAAALGTWPNEWQQTGTKSIGKSLPCIGDWTQGSSSGMGASLGSNGEQDFFSFDSVDSARASLQALVSNLQACAASPATVRTVAGTGALPVTVAVGSGNDGRVTWIVQRGPTVGYLTVPGTTSPPDGVSEAVGGLVGDVLAHAGESPPPVESSAPAQQQGSSTSSGSSSAAAPQG